MTGDPVSRLLRARGAADHVVAGGLEGLVDAWEETARQIEAGYPLTLDDYLNDLDGRRIIEEVLATSPEPDGPLLTRLRRADARVRAATSPIRRCLWSGEGSWSPRRHWWYFVVPRSPGGDLKADLDAAGFVEGGAAGP